MGLLSDFGDLVFFFDGIVPSRIFVVVGLRKLLLRKDLSVGIRSELVNVMALVVVVRCDFAAYGRAGCSGSGSYFVGLVVGCSNAC